MDPETAMKLADNLKEALECAFCNHFAPGQTRDIGCSHSYCILCIKTMMAKNNPIECLACTKPCFIPPNPETSLKKDYVKEDVFNKLKEFGVDMGDLVKKVPVEAPQPLKQEEVAILPQPPKKEEQPIGGEKRGYNPEDFEPEKKPKPDLKPKDRKPLTEEEEQKYLNRWGPDIQNFFRVAETSPGTGDSILDMHPEFAIEISQFIDYRKSSIGKMANELGFT
jgi:hypothetical protein